MKKKVSLKDIAEKLGISISTVSRALKDHPNISKEIKDKVNKLAEEWNYSPNPFALGLLQDKTFTLGVIVPDIATHFYSSIIKGIDAEARKNNYHIVISSSDESYEKEKESIKNLLRLQVDGLIICLSKETSDPNLFLELQKEHFPIVFFDRILQNPLFSAVIAKNEEASINIVSHFVDKGYKQIAFISGPNHLSICQQRNEGYKKGLKKNNLVFKEEYLVSTKLSFEAAIEATRYLLNLPNPPDAIFGINDLVTFGIMDFLKKQSKKIPHEIGLIGFTDEFHSKLVDPALTSVSHPTFEMGIQVAKLILTQINSPNSFIPHTIELDTLLIERESTKRKK